MNIQNIKSKKRGMTLIELMVAMGIFTVITTLAVGSFVAVSRMRMYALNLKESQQKVRIITEMISRYARQADTVIVEDDSTIVPPEDGKGKIVKMYFKTDTIDTALNKSYASRFDIKSEGGVYKMKYYECKPTPTTPATRLCLDGSLVGVDLFSGSMQLDKTSKFVLNNNSNLKSTAGPTENVKAYAPSLNVILHSQLNKTTDPYYNSDAFDIETKVILENLR
ncbi:MAG: type II secretion system protein [bacterium]